MEKKSSFDLKEYFENLTELIGRSRFDEGSYALIWVSLLFLVVLAFFMFMYSLSGNPPIDNFTSKISSVTTNIVSIESDKAKAFNEPIIHQVAEGNQGQFTVEYVSFIHHNDAKDYFDSIKREFIGLNFQGSLEVSELENISDINLVNDMRNFFEYGIQYEGNLYRVVCDYNAVYIIKVKAAEDAEETSKFLFGILGYR